MKYSEKLKDPRWQKKRLEVFQRDDFSCQQCGDTETTLCVHHLRYMAGRDPWEYPEEMLLTLCEECHNAEYEGMKESIDSLVEQIKDRVFLSGAVDDLSKAFNCLIIRFPPEVMATMIAWAFGNKGMMEEIGRRYFEYLEEKNAKNPNNKT